MAFPLRLLAVFALLFPAAAAQAQYRCVVPPPATETTIAVYTNLEGTECAGRTMDGLLTGSIWVNLSGAAAGGITGAEYRIQAGAVPGSAYDYFYRFPLYSIYFYPDPDAVLNFGDPFHGGTNTVFAACRPAPRVRLGTFLLIEATPEPIALYVEEHEDPSNYTFCCPLVTLCDGPVFTKICATGISDDPYDYDLGEVFFAGVNMEDDKSVGAGRCPILSFRTTGVAEAAWSTVKSLYR